MIVMHICLLSFISPHSSFPLSPSPSLHLSIPPSISPSLYLSIPPSPSISLSLHLSLFLQTAGGDHTERGGRTQPDCFQSSECLSLQSHTHTHTHTHTENHPVKEINRLSDYHLADNAIHHAVYSESVYTQTQHTDTNKCAHTQSHTHTHTHTLSHARL